MCRQIHSADSPAFIGGIAEGSKKQYNPGKEKDRKEDGPT